MKFLHSKVVTRISILIPIFLLGGCSVADWCYLTHNPDVRMACYQGPGALQKAKAQRRSSYSYYDSNAELLGAGIAAGAFGGGAGTAGAADSVSGGSSFYGNPWNTTNTGMDAFFDKQNRQLEIRRALGR